MDKSDIVIIGGGLVGLSAALALQRTDRHIRVLEANASHQQKPTGLNARSIAISYASVQIFKALGLWQEIKKQASPIKSIHISSQGRWGVTRIRAMDYQLAAVGYVIESWKLNAILLDQVQNSNLIKLDTGAAFESLDFTEGVQLRYHKDNKLNTICAGLILIADGAQSKARSSLGIEHCQIDYQQTAIITNIEVSRPVPGAAYERFTDHGPLALLPLGGNIYSCVWTHSPRFSEELIQFDEQSFIESLQRSFGYRLGLVERVGQRHSFPLYRTEAAGLVKNSCLLIGNAANTLHPVAGQGLNLALRDVACLNHLLESQAIRNYDGRSIRRLLDEYKSMRVFEQQSVIRLGDGLVTLFSNDLPVLKHIRAGALAMLDIFPPIKAKATMTGMGFGFVGNPMLRGRR